MTEKQERYMYYRIRTLPQQLDRARRRYVHLLREAKRLDLTHLIEDHEHGLIDQA